MVTCPHYRSRAGGDSGDLETDLPDCSSVSAAKAGGKRGRSIDEVQFLSQTDLVVLIVSLHETTQRELPVLFFGALLSQVTALSGETNSYAERLLRFPPVEALPIMATAVCTTTRVKKNIINKHFSADYATVIVKSIWR
jgi:hypothetical protein